jgi:thiamine kinase-like enzyme
VRRPGVAARTGDRPHDAAPFNAVWRDDDLVGFIDWDTAGPASREMDLAYVALSRVPLYPVDAAVDLGYPASDDRAARLKVLLDAYGYDSDRVPSGRPSLNAPRSTPR